MKNLKYVLLVIIAIILWYLLDDKKQTRPIVSVQQVNQQESLKKSHHSPVNKKQLNDVLIDSFSVTNNSDIESDPQLTYLQAYRNTVRFKKCSFIINDINNKISPLIKFKKDAAFDMFQLPDEPKKQATDLQIQYFSEFTEWCQSFLKDDNETYNSALKRLHDVFNSAVPQTEPEKVLKKGLELFKQHEELKKSIRNATQSHSLLSEDELVVIKSQVKNINKQIKELQANPDAKSNNQIQSLISELSNKRSQLYIKIRNNKVTSTDEEAKKRAEYSVLQHKNTMIDFLKNNNSPDILLLYSSMFFYPATFEFNPILEDMKRELATYEPYLLLSLYEVGIKLAACAMNYPCDDQSLFVLNYCIGERKYFNMSPSACGKSLEDFYFNAYLSPNQLEDVSKYLNYILENYAKN